MSMIGLIGLLIAFAGTALSVVCLVLGTYLQSHKQRSAGESIVWGGHVAALVTTAALTLCCGVLVFCFMTGDVSIEYVLHERSDSSDGLGWLYKLSGLWAGREGSLLFWAWLISAFNAVVAVRNMGNPRKLDSMALLVSQLVLAAFVGVLLFSENNMPFTATPARYFDSAGNLLPSASSFGMNALLEHWAMAIHPPTLFVGYAGLTIPFAFAIAALITNDSSKEWVVRSQRYALFSWLFLGIGIGLGAVWAYVVLGWGGYWGWDPVENASLLSWIVGVALIHSLTVYRQRGAFKRWSVMCACLTFAFVILGTFISRSGLVQSVHAFEGDPVSLFLFGALIVLSVVAGIVGLIVRNKSFAPKPGDADEVESMVSRDAAYCFNNVIMVVFAFLLAYLTIASALPTWLPFGGQTVSTGTYNAIARPLGIIYLAILAVCPLLSWGRTQGKVFLKRARIPAIFALVLFALLMVYFVTYLLPTYNANVEYYTANAAAGDQSAAEMLSTLTPGWYYNGLAVVGFLVASLLFFNSLFMIGRAVRSYRESHSCSMGMAVGAMFTKRAASLGGYLSHFGMAVILVGLIGSSMYVTERVDYLPFDEEADTVSKDFEIQDYRLVYTGNEIVEAENGDDIMYTIFLDAYKGDEFLASVDPTVQFVMSTQQQKLLASVIGFPQEDLFVVYRGISSDGSIALDVRVNPLISCVWLGFFLLMVGVCVSTFGGRMASRKLSEPERSQAKAGDEAPAKGSKPAKSAESKEGAQAAAASEAPEAAPKGEGSGVADGPAEKPEPAEDAAKTAVEA